MQLVKFLDAICEYSDQGVLGMTLDHYAREVL